MRRSGRLLSYISAAVILSLGSLSPGAAAFEPWLDSPDGDPLIQTIDLPAQEYPLPLPEAGGQRGLTTDFLLTGELPEGDSASGVAFTPDGTKIVVAQRESANLIVFDASTRAFLTAIPLSGSPQGVAISPDGTRAVTANVFEDTASIVDLVGGTELITVAVGDQPGVVRITPDGTTAVVGNTVDASVSVIDVASATEVRRITGTGFVATISAAFEPGAIAVTFSQFEIADNTTLVHPDFFADEIDLVDITTGTVTSLPSAADPRGVDVTPNGATAVIAHTGSARTVSVIDVGAGSISKTIPTGIDLFGGSIAINPTGTKAVAAVLNACRVINLVTDAVSGNLNTASVNGIETTADGDYALTIGFFGSLISYTSETIVANLNNVVSTSIGATSPTDARGVLLATTFGEDMVVVNTNGAAGFTEGVVPSGPPPEGDKARTVTISPDAQTAVVTNILSDNATIVDLSVPVVEAIVAVGDRPSEAEITPDGTRAVVANLDSNFATVIDLVAHSVITNITISRRASQVEISPDGQFAYLAVVADGDGVWRINLNTLAVQGTKIITGNMGGVLYLFNQSSGMTLSHDGATLVTCGSFSDNVSIIDTATWTRLLNLPVGDFPTRATFSADDSKIYIANRDGDTISVVQNLGAASFVERTISVGQQPFQMVLAPGGGTLYVSNFQDENIGVVDLAAGVMRSTIPLPDNPAGVAINVAGTELYAATGTWSVSIGPGPAFSIGQSGEFSVIDPALETITDQVVTNLPPAALAYEKLGGQAAIPSPFGDGITLLQVGGATGVTEIPLASQLRLERPRPNPARTMTEVRFSLEHKGHVALGVFDVSGRRVATLVDGVLPAGEHRVAWDARDAAGVRAAPGVYYVRMDADGVVESTNVVVVR